jgi:hypothetical protein
MMFGKISVLWANVGIALAILVLAELVAVFAYWMRDPSTANPEDLFGVSMDRYAENSPVRQSLPCRRSKPNPMDSLHTLAIAPYRNRVRSYREEWYQANTKPKTLTRSGSDLVLRRFHGLGPRVV